MLSLFPEARMPIVSHLPSPRFCRSVRCGVLVLAALSAFPTASAHAVQLPSPVRFFRHFTQDDGLPSAFVFGLSQDPDGHLWIGTAGGLARYGGRDFVNVRPDLFAGGIEQLTTSRAGDVAVIERGRLELWIGRDREFQRARGPGGESLRPVISIAYDGGDTLWVVRRDGGLRRRAPDGAWIEPDATLKRLQLYRAFAQSDGSLLLATRDPGGAVLWSWRGGQSLRRLAQIPGLVTTAVRSAHGTIWFASNEWGDATLYRLVGDRLHVGLRRSYRPQSVIVRGDVVYYSDPAGLLILGDEGTAERILRQTVRSGGPLLVDREGSLWLGTASGLVQLPEPETASWGEEHGLMGSHAEFIAVSSRGVWLSTWQGLGLLKRAGDGWRTRDLQADYGAWAATRLCVDGESRLWLWTQGRGTVPPSISSISDGAPRPLAPVGIHMDCNTAEDGTVVFVADTLVYRSQPGGRIEHLGPLPSHMRNFRAQVAADATGVIHVVEGSSSCDTPVAGLKARGAAAWRCSPLPDVGELRDLIGVRGPGGRAEVWLASLSGGVSRRVEGAWRPVGDVERLAQRAANGLVRSPRGGVWAFGYGVAVRLEPVAGRWRIVEELSGWHGIAGDVHGLREMPDGTVWLASWHGVTRVPASARTGPPTAPPARLAALRVDGMSMPELGAVVPASHRAIEIEFAAGALRDPHRVRYRTRIDEVEWTVTPDPVFRVARLPAGRHVVEAEASLDGIVWGQPYRLELSVARAWYARGWVLTSIAALVIGLALMAHRLRTAYLVGLERQRTRIAMDLHDELGAGLGSLGILGGLVAEGSAPLPAQRTVGETIARTAGELGESLHDIVYSLRTGESRVEHLAEQLTSRGRTLFTGNHVRFATNIALDRNGGIAPAVSREAYRIAVEAMHNAARHAGATVVELGLSARDAHGLLHLWVQDDGRGIDPRTLQRPRGMGLITMQRRADELGGVLRIESSPGAGTRIDIRFDSRGRSVDGRRSRVRGPRGKGGAD